MNEPLQPGDSFAFTCKEGSKHSWEQKVLRVHQITDEVIVIDDKFGSFVLLRNQINTYKIPSE